MIKSLKEASFATYQRIRIKKKNQKKETWIEVVHTIFNKVLLAFDTILDILPRWFGQRINKNQTNKKKQK